MNVRPLRFERDLAELEDHLRVIEQHSFATVELHDSIRALRVRLNTVRSERFAHLDAWQIVQVARHEHRPQTLDYLDLIFDEFIELHGDRCYADDPTIATGFARIDGRKVMVVGHRKGRTLEERNRFCYGMAQPEGYRKSLRTMKLAAKFGLPIITFLDSAGAYPGITAEARGQAGLIAMNLREMARLKTPIVTAVIGEGGSDGALAIGVADYLCMLQFAYYSVMTPEGCAGILWKHVKHADRAALALRLTASEHSASGMPSFRSRSAGRTVILVGWRPRSNANSCAVCESSSRSNHSS